MTINRTVFRAHRNDSVALLPTFRKRSTRPEAHGALLTTFPGDTTMATLEEVRAFAQGGSGG